MLGILAALPQELDATTRLLADPHTSSRAGRTFTQGLIGQHSVITTPCGIGKVAAAMTTARLLADHDVDAVLVVGVAGALDPALKVGDMLVADALVQHDLDASPLFQPQLIPSLGVRTIATDDALRSSLAGAAEGFVQHDAARHATAFAEFGITAPRVVQAPLASGDRFIGTDADRRMVRERVPEAVCVDMESAACAQVCREHRVPLAVLRIVSDRADEHAAFDFARFLERVAGEMTAGIVRRMLGT